MMKQTNWQKVLIHIMVIVFLFVVLTDISFAEDGSNIGEPTGEISSDKWHFVIAAYGLSWLGLLGYLFSLYKRGLR